MLVRSRYKIDHHHEEVGIAVAQWTVSTGKGKKLRIQVLIPKDSSKLKYCEVEILCEEEQEWLIDGVDGSYGTRKLTPNELALLPNASKQVAEDLYYVWDDGAASHTGRAKRLYDHFHDTITANAPRARMLREQAAQKRYENDVRYAKSRGWEMSSIPEPVIHNSYGELQQSHYVD